ncbi:hypothetical protein [Salinisphaera aquimarina]|uniref:Glycine zipper 2TM domain-containing protein n=1 Tax=Salinisphaera aquimarina TaxID=2094031 RepID=A0ABV7EMY2_9GAMM
MHSSPVYNKRRSTWMAALASFGMAAATLSGCASNPKPDVDPIFTAVPGGRYDCYYQQDDRNVVVKGATGTAGQAVIGGAAGGLLGNQFGSGSGRDIATGVGVAAGVAAGAWNANRMKTNRINDCQQQQQSRQPQQQSGYRYQGS